MNSAEASRVAVVIGRWQLPHLQHRQLIAEALSLAPRVLVAIGSAARSRNPRNPFTAQERCDMLACMFEQPERERLSFVGLRDLYHDQRWAESVRHAVACMAPGARHTTLVGHFKDASSAYLNLFPQWGLHAHASSSGEGSTALRDIFFSTEDAAASLQQLEGRVHPQVLTYLRRWSRLPVFAERVAEHRAVAQYRQRYPGPVYWTADALVEAAGHVLLIERKQTIGQGLWALPGGFRDEAECALDNAVRELREETGLALPEAQLRAGLQSHQAFTAPGRSARGDIRTDAFHFKLSGCDATDLPAVKGLDDARSARWWPRSELASLLPSLFEDHDVILEHFLGAMAEPFLPLQPGN